jgi:hypothetical protein
MRRFDVAPFLNQEPFHMRPLRSSSCRHLLSALTALTTLTASALCLVACSSESFDVFTPDEQRPDVGAIARGETRLPLPVGTPVPDADGHARPLTATMQGIRVKFVDMGVDGTCDSDVGGEGEFYYDMGINARSTVRRPSDRWYSAKEGQSIPVDSERTFFVEPGETFAVRMSASEADDFLNFKDDVVGSQSIVHAAADVRGGSLWLDAELGSGDCALHVTYTLERVQ